MSNELSPEQITAVRETLSSPGWAIIRAQIAEAKTELEVIANVERDPFLSGKRAAEAFGVGKAIRLIEAIPTANEPEEEGDEEYAPPYGEDAQEKLQES